MKSFQKTLTTMCLSALFAGCATVDYSKETPQTLQAQYEVVDSPFDKSKTSVGPEVRARLEGVEMAHYSARLAMVQDKATAVKTTALVINITYLGKNWLFFEGATMPGGRRAVSKRGVRDVSCSQIGCTYNEQITVILSTGDLPAAKPFQIRLDAQRGAGIVTLPAVYVDAYLAQLAK